MILTIFSQVTWENDSDPLNPMNWSPSRRLTSTLLLSLGGLVSLMSASMIAPALPQISEDLNMDLTSTSLTLSIYLLAFAFGPMLIGPMSELYGRKKVWLICHVWFILWNTLSPVGKSKGLMIVGRFMSGLGGSVGIALPGPIMADIWPISKRGTSLALSMFMPYLGAALGPILGGYTSSSLGYSWIFWIVSLFDAAITLLSFFILKESYAPVLLARKARDLSLQTGQNHHTIYSIKSPEQTPKSKLTTALSRPFKLLVTRPVIQLNALFIAYNFGAYTIALTTYAQIWTKQYHQSTSASGLHYIAISIGSAGSSQVTGYLTDIVWAYLKKRAPGNKHVPEFRVPLMIPGTILMPLGLLLYGWSAQHTLHWLVTDVGMGIFVFGLMSGTQSSNAYLADEFAEHYASANAAYKSVSNIVGFLFPLFAESMYGKLGYGWGNTLLAGGFVVCAAWIPGVLWVFGERIRGVGKGRVL